MQEKLLWHSVEVIPGDLRLTIVNLLTGQVDFDEALIRELCEAGVTKKDMQVTCRTVGQIGLALLSRAAIPSDDPD